MIGQSSSHDPHQLSVTDQSQGFLRASSGQVTAPAVVRRGEGSNAGSQKYSEPYLLPVQCIVSQRLEEWKEMEKRKNKERKRGNERIDLRD